MSVWVKCNILGLLVKTLTVDEKYCLVYSGNLTQKIQMQLPNKEKTFSQFFSSFLKSKLKFEHFQKKMTLIADIFPELQTPKDVVR